MKEYTFWIMHPDVNLFLLMAQPGHCWTKLVQVSSEARILGEGGGWGRGGGVCMCTCVCVCVCVCVCMHERALEGGEKWVLSACVCA